MLKWFKNSLPSYPQTILMYPNPSLYTCTARIWFREIGFSLTYGALMLKTWRYVFSSKRYSSKSNQVDFVRIYRADGSGRKMMIKSLSFLTICSVLFVFCDEFIHVCTRILYATVWKLIHGNKFECLFCWRHGSKSVG